MSLLIGSIQTAYLRSEKSFFMVNFNRMIAWVNKCAFYCFVVFLFQQPSYADAGLIQCLKFCDALYVSTHQTKQWSQCINNCYYDFSMHYGPIQLPEGYSYEKQIKNAPCSQTDKIEDQPVYRSDPIDRLKKKHNISKSNQ